MAGNSLESLLAWMKDNSRMLDWGLIVVFDRRKANGLIIQEYIRRFGAGSYLPRISGDVMLVNDKWMESIRDFNMDVPRLSFENADLNDSKAMLTMAVLGGTQITLKKENAVWSATKVVEIDPLQGPKLHLNLLLNEVHGDIADDGRVRLDLSKSDDFVLTFATSPTEQRLGGEFFRDLFNQLDPADRVYPIGEIRPGRNELMKPQSFELRTQRSGPEARDPLSSEFGNGAILALVRTMHRFGGNFPGKDYRYLLADGYTASVLFDRRRATGDTLLNAIRNLFDSDGFDYSFDEHGELMTATMTSGALKIAPASITFPLNGTMVTCGTSEISLSPSKTQPLMIEFSTDKVTVDWQAHANVMFSLFATGTEPGAIEGAVTTQLQAEYMLEEKEDGVWLRQTAYHMEMLFAEPTEPTVADWDWNDLSLALLFSLYMAAGYFFSVKAYVELSFKAIIDTHVSINDYLSETVQLNFGHAIEGDKFYAPGDVFHPAQISPVRTSFVISPIEPLILQGGTQQFSTEPVVPGLEWDVENLMEGPDDPGTIDKSTGVYKAAQVSGQFNRVRVTATDPETNHASSALVTVVPTGLAVNPLMAVCDVGNSVELQAGSLDDAPRQWSIKNPVSESGELRPSEKPEVERTYHPGSAGTDKTYTLDEIEVTSATAPAQSVYVLALHKPPALTVEIVTVDLEKGQVQLRAMFNGNPLQPQWSLPLNGAGEIDDTGLYRVTENALMRCDLVYARLEVPPLGVLEGYLILPLPLGNIPALLKGAAS